MVSNLKEQLRWGAWIAGGGGCGCGQPLVPDAHFGPALLACARPAAARWRLAARATKSQQRRRRLRASPPSRSLQGLTWLRTSPLALGWAATLADRPAATSTWRPLTLAGAFVPVFWPRLARNRWERSESRRLKRAKLLSGANDQLLAGRPQMACGRLLAERGKDLLLASASASIAVAAAAASQFAMLFSPNFVVCAASASAPLRAGGHRASERARSLWRPVGATVSPVGPPTCRGARCSLAGSADNNKGGGGGGRGGGATATATAGRRVSGRRTICMQRSIRQQPASQQAAASSAPFRLLSGSLASRKARSLSRPRELAFPPAQRSFQPPDA